VRAWYDARRAVARLEGDVVIVHDLELVPWIRARKNGRLVWDVHEDFVAMVSDTVWIPGPLRVVARGIVRVVEGLARRKCEIMLAEDAYRSRFPHAPVVPNTTWVDDQLIPCQVPDRVVYVGRLSFDRGVAEMIEVGRRLKVTGGPKVILVGSSDADCRSAIESAVRDGFVEWRGPLANPEALALARGSLVGLSLLRDQPNYVVSRPTKLLEYMAIGIPVISTPLPLARELLRSADCGVVTAAWCGEALVDEVVGAVDDFASNDVRRFEEGRRAWEHVRAEWNWTADGPRFVDFLEYLAGKPR